MPALLSRKLAQPTRDEETSNTLLRRVRDVTDAVSWGEFVRRYEPLLLSYVRGRGLQENDALDVVQDVFARLHRALPSFQLNRERGRFRTWLYQVASSAPDRLGPRPQSPGPRRAGLARAAADRRSRRAVRGRLLERRASACAGACFGAGAGAFAAQDVGLFRAARVAWQAPAPPWPPSWV